MVVGIDKQHYYLKELARLIDGKFVIPVSWYYYDETLCGDCWSVDFKVNSFRFVLHNVVLF